MPKKSRRDREVLNKQYLNPGYVNPQEIIRHSVALLKDTTYFFPQVSSSVGDSQKEKCISTNGENDFIVLYDYKHKNKHRIFDNRIPSEILRQYLTQYLPVYFTYLIDDKGIRLGHVKDALELGVPHMMLSRHPDAKASIAGEIKIDGNRVYFNFMSGTFSQALDLQNYPTAYENYREVVKQIIKALLPAEEGPFSVKFTEDVLFPNDRPSEEELDEFCSMHHDQPYIYFDPQSPRCGKMDLARARQNDVCKIRAKVGQSIQKKKGKLDMTVQEILECPWCDVGTSQASSSAEDDFLSSQHSQSSMFDDMDEDFLSTPSQGSSSMFDNADDDFLSSSQGSSSMFDDEFLGVMYSDSDEDDELYYHSEDVDNMW
jgi:hypothetical protein